MVCLEKRVGAEQVLGHAIKEARGEHGHGDKSSETAGQQGTTMRASLLVLYSFVRAWH